MTTNAQKVHHIGTPDAGTNSEAEEGMAKANRDMSKVAIFLSIVSILLMVVFFFGLNQNVKGLSTQAKLIPAMQDNMVLMNKNMESMDTRLLAVEELPARARNIIMGAMLEEMAGSTGYLQTQIDDPAAAEKLQAAAELLRQVQADLKK